MVWRGMEAEGVYSLRGIISATIVIQVNSSCDPNNDNGDPTTEQIKSENKNKMTESEIIV